MIDNYKCIIFDLDDTMCDYTAAKSKALLSIAKELKEFDIDSEKYVLFYKLIEPILFDLFAKKKIGLKTYRKMRFLFPLQLVNNNDYAVDNWVYEANRKYVLEANTNINLFDDVKPFLYYIEDKGIEYCILTNGPSDGQRLKIRSLPIKLTENKIFISEEIGIAKPSKEAFYYVLEKMDMTIDDCLVIGDSIEHDIYGAQNAEIDAILIDRYNRHKGTECKTIKSFFDLIYDR